MSEKELTATVRRVSPFANVIDIHGDITHFSESALTEAYEQAVQDKVRSLIINFSDMAYMNSSGIGMLVKLLIRARREGKNIVGYGLSDHYCNIFEITRLDQVIPIYSTEEIALASAEPFDLPEREY